MRESLTARTPRTQRTALTIERPTRRWTLELWNRAAELGLQVQGDLGPRDIAWPPPFGAKMVIVFPRRLRGLSGRVIGRDFGVLNQARPMGRGKIAPGFVLLRLKSSRMSKKSKADVLPSELVEQFSLTFLKSGAIRGASRLAR